MLPQVTAADAGVAEPLVDRQLDLAADAQGLVVVAALVGDVGDLAPGDGGGPGVAEPLVDRQLDLAADPQRLVVVARAGRRCRRSYPIAAAASRSDPAAVNSW